MDPIVWPCHKIEWPPHSSINLQGKILSYSNIFNLYYNNDLNFLGH